MRQQVFHATAKFQVTDSLLAAARAKAKRDGMTFSELCRSALRRELQGAN